MTLKELSDALLSAGVATGASIIRVIFVPQEGSAWDKGLKFLGSILFGSMVGILIRHTETQGFLFKYVDYIVAATTLTANEIITTWVRRTINIVIVYFENKLTSAAKKAEEPKGKETEDGK